MFTIFSQALTSSGWSLQGGVSQVGLSFETVNYVAGVPSITTRYGPPPGADENLFSSPIYDLGQLCTVVLSLDVLKPWIVDSASIGAWIQANVSNPELLSTPGRAFQVYVQPFGEDGNPLSGGIPFDGDTELTGRYFKLAFYGPKLYTTDDTLYPPIDYADWKIDLTGGVLTAKMPITAESVSTTTSATVPVTVPLAERYLAVTGIASSGESTAFVNVTTEPPLTGEYLPNSIKVNGFDAAGARIANKAYVTILGVRGRKTLTNWAASANGGTASATSFVFANTPAKANDGKLDSAGGAFWYATAAQPQTLTVDYGATRNVTEIVVIFLKDSPASVGEPNIYDIATLYHAQSFTVQEYVSGVWTTISGGTVTGNTKVMRRFPVTNSNATQVRVTITASPDGWSRVAELMAIGPA